MTNPHGPIWVCHNFLSTFLYQHFFLSFFIKVFIDNILVHIIRALNNTTSYDYSKRYVMRGRYGLLYGNRQVTRGLAICIHENSSFCHSMLLAADCAMKVNLKTILIISVTAFMFFSKDNALSTVAAVNVILAVIVANPCRGLWGRWWSRRRRGGSVRVEGGEGGHLQPPQRHHPQSSYFFQLLIFVHKRWVGDTPLIHKPKSH